MSQAAKQGQIVDMLASTPLFSSVKRKQVQAIASSGKELTYESGQTLIKEGDKGIGFFLILSGGVEVRLKGKLLSKLGPGDFFGEMALFADEPRSADVTAMKPTVCFGLTQWAFMGLVRSQPEIAVGVMKELARRLRGTNKAFTE